MKRRDLITGGVAAVVVVVTGLTPSEPSGIFAGARVEWTDSESRVFYVDLGSMPPEQAERYLYEVASEHSLEIVQRA